MTAQQQIDVLWGTANSARAAVGRIAANLTTIKAGIDSLKAALAAAQTANPTVDLSALTTAVNALNDGALAAATASDATVADLPTSTPPTP